jgi:hypothetical protein
MNKAVLLFVCCCCIVLSSHSQKPWELDAEFMKSIGKGFRGNMAGGRYESYNNKNSWSIGVTYNFSSKKTYSQHKGFAVYAGYRHAFSIAANGSSGFAGLRAYFAFQNYEGKTRANDLAITPMAEAGYYVKTWKGIFATPTLGYGYTIKISHDYNSLQEDEGGRFLPALAVGYRF